MRFRGYASAAVAALAAASAAAAATAPTSAQISAGKKVFASAGCGKCHTLAAANAKGSVGPNLDKVKPALGAIVTQVSQGGRFMPPFAASMGGSLSATQVKDVAAFVYGSEHHVSGSAGAAASHGAKSVKVTAGKPSEFRFTLSTRKVATGKVVFTITNRGKLVHDFKVCTVPSSSTAKNSCNGKGSKKLSPGHSVKLTVTFEKKGSYVYLCTVPGHAAAGMKGLLRAG